MYLLSTLDALKESKMIKAHSILSVIAFAAATTGVTSLPARPYQKSVEIRVDDVDRFFALFAATNGRPTAEEVEQQYIEPASPGLRHLMRVRNVSASNIAKAIAEKPDIYANARTCLNALPKARRRLETTLSRLFEIYPAASNPPITILISRGSPVAIAGPGTGVQISLEAICSPMAARFLSGNIEDRLVHVASHEFVHSQQPPEKASPTVLERALEEGVAEFLGEIVSGGVANVAVHRSARGRQIEIERRFLLEIDSKNLSGWFDNTTEHDVGQLGYWVGYRIAKAYYRKNRHKPDAVASMLNITDAKRFLRDSGWSPGGK